jgi:S-adenosylmethionine:tRNA ribosyltransferase-isomerase
MIEPALSEPLEAVEPAEVRGADRGDVALLVASRADDALVHARFRELPRFLRPGDLLVVNTSATLPAALPARLDGEELELHLSTPAGGTRWVVELRTAERLPFRTARAGARLELPAGAHDAYQTVFALHPGSAEMPSAGRPFSADLVTELVARGVLFAPLTLHAGVSSLELGESPYPERYRVPAETARLVNAVRGWGGRVIAVGTTVVRALETVSAPDGTVTAGDGLTSLVVTPERGLRTLDGLLTGWHEPSSSHLQLLEAAAGPELLRRSYEAAAAHGYRFHEFGDSHLIL